MFFKVYNCLYVGQTLFLSTHFVRSTTFTYGLTPRSLRSTAYKQL